MNMPDDLRHLFADSPEPRIDLAEVMRRSRARRLPKVLGIGLAGVLAIGGVVTVSLQGLSLTTPMSAGDSSSGSAEESAGTYDLDASRMDESRGLVADLALEPGDGPALVSLTNTGTETLRGEVTGASVRLLDDEGVIADRVADMAPVVFELAPGQAVSVEAVLPMTPVTSPPEALQVAASLTVSLGPDELPIVLETALRPLT